MTLAANIDKYNLIQQQAQRHNARLVAVSKRQPTARVRQVYDAGCRMLGENYVDGLVERRQQFPEAELHYIGAIQTRKLKDIVKNADYIHSISRLKEARIAQQIETDLALQRKWLLQVNIGAEGSKNGVKPELACELFSTIRAQTPNLALIGLMTIGPRRPSESEIEHDFCTMYELFQSIAASHPECTELSMGMSADWQLALQHNATIIRVGSTIFGERNNP